MWQKIKCLFGFHEWQSCGSYYGLYESCKHCGKNTYKKVMKNSERYKREKNQKGKNIWYKIKLIWETILVCSLFYSVYGMWSNFDNREMFLLNAVSALMCINILEDN